MAELFKNVYSLQSIRLLAKHLHKNHAQLDQDSFVKTAMLDHAKNEMKQRANQIVKAFELHLPEDFKKAAEIFLASLSHQNEEGGWNTRDTDYQSGIEGWLVAPVADYVGIHGQADFDVSMNLLKELTKRFSSEFGIRYFLLSQTKLTLACLHGWLNDPNQHVRRLISEGTRPRLPWGMRLKPFIDDPLPVIQLLTLLKDDKEEYVRRSVANNLNDISKDHPKLVSEIARSWLDGANEALYRLVKHACRTLLKQGHTSTLKAFGFLQPHYKDADLNLDSKAIKMGESLCFNLSIIPTTDLPHVTSGATNSAQTALHHAINNDRQSWMIDFIIHHQKANGKTSAKVFKWKQVNVKAGEPLSITKNHPFKPITTRVYYSGEHAIEIMVNGHSIAKQLFQLTVE